MTNNMLVFTAKLYIYEGSMAREEDSQQPLTLVGVKEAKTRQGARVNPNVSWD